MFSSKIVLMKKGMLLAVILLAYIQLNAQWKQQQYIIGTFYDPQMYSQELQKDTAGYRDRIKGVKAANFNLLSGLDGCYTNEYIAYKLGVISDVGLQTLLMNYKTLEKGNTTFTSAKATDWFNFVSTLSKKRQDAIYGQLIFDEPSVSRAADVKSWVTYAKKTMPGKLAYVNLLPCYVFKTRAEYESYLDIFLSSNGPDKFDVVSYDFYPFIQGGIKPEFFYNLYILDKKAQGRPLWYYVLTTKHREYVEIDTYKLNFMVFAPLIYGAKGTMYFTYETNATSKMPFGDALIGADYKPTSKYYTVKAINKFLRDVWGPIVMNSEKTGTYHVSKNPYNQALQDAEIINDKTPLIADINNENIAVGIFHSLKDPNEYNLMVFNKSSSNINNTVVSLKDTYKSVSISVPYNKFTSSNNAFLQQKSNTTKVSFSLSPGEGRIIKLKK